MSRLDRLTALCQAEIPGHRMIWKQESTLMHLLAAIVRPINPDFDSQFTVVIGRTVYLAMPVERYPPDRLSSLLAHELIHQMDQRRWHIGFYLSYLLLLPTWRTARAVWERRAYAMDLLLARERGGEAAVRQVAEWMVGVFAGSGYGWMWGGREAAQAFLAPTVQQVLSGELDAVEPYRTILAAWRGPEGAHLRVLGGGLR